MKRSKHSLSHYKLLTMDGGWIVPISCFEALPGDTIQQATSMLVRASPLLSPVMHPVEVKIHHWFVPNRLLWIGWEDFITGTNPTTPPYVIPTSTDGPGSLADYLGIAPLNDQPGYLGPRVSALPFRAYTLIYNEFYRDQDIQTEIPIELGSGVDNSNYVLQRANWEKDYFTTSRPWQQKGSSVSVPVQAVTSSNIGVTSQTGAIQATLQVGAGGSIGSGPALPNGEQLRFRNFASGRFDPLRVNLSDLRQAAALQRWEEARARYGSRYTEYLRYLGIRSSDARLQRPEYLGGGRQTIQFSEVLQTAPGTDSYNDAVGALKGHGIGALRSNRYRRFFEEHGIVMSFAIIRPRAIYTDGTPRMFFRQTKEAYWQRELEHIGQQPIFDNEVYMRRGISAPTAEDGMGTFGWQDRYAEYRHIPSTIAGEYRTILNYWHLARQFAVKPTLNSDFITCQPAKRVFASQATHSFYVMANHSIQSRRMVSNNTQSYIR